MAEYVGTKLSVNWIGFETDYVDVSDWTNNQDSQQKRSDIISAIMHNHSHGQLQAILRTGWDVNEVLNVPAHFRRRRCCGPAHLSKKWVKRTALYEAARRGFTEGVKILLDAGAKYKISGTVENPLTLALENDACPSDLIHLLLQHGADPDDHDGEICHIPIFQAIKQSLCNAEHCARIVQLLLMYRTDGTCNDINGYNTCPLAAVINIRIMSVITRDNIVVVEGNLLQFKRATIEVFKTLLNNGANVNRLEDGPLLHKMVGKKGYHEFPTMPKFVFLPEHLDLFFHHGGNINVEDEEQRTTLRLAVERGCHSNSIRWLIRHGADTSVIKVTSLIAHFLPNKAHWYTGQFIYFPETPLMLLQAGMRVSHGAQTQLSKVEMAISAWLQADNEAEPIKAIESAWTQLKMTEEREEFSDESLQVYPDDNHCQLRVRAMSQPQLLQRIRQGEPYEKKQQNFRKSTFPQYWTQQMGDLQEFSDESLYVYPEVTHWYSQSGDKSIFWQRVCDQVHSVLKFLSQTQSLQWYCRRRVRESLVSLQPSVVNTLPGPAILKRYILCHEI